jgi:hypothetical protein
MIARSEVMEVDGGFYEHFFMSLSLRGAARD